MLYAFIGTLDGFEKGCEIVLMMDDDVERRSRQNVQQLEVISF